MIERRNMPSQNSLRNRTQVLAAWALLLIFALFPAACEYPGIPHPLVADAEVSAPTAVPTPAAPAENQNPGTKEAEPVDATVRISLKDFRLDPDKVTGKAGTVTFVLKNEGRYTHDFRVEGQGIDDRAPKVGQGRTFEWQIALTPGAYRISCPISNHADRGMIGTLEVVE